MNQLSQAQSNPVNKDTEGGLESVCIKWIEFRENVRPFFAQGRSKLCDNKVAILRGCPWSEIWL